MKICIAGKNSIAIDTIKYLLNGLNLNHDNICIITNRTDDGEDTWQPSLKKYSLENELALVDLENIYNIENLLFISLEYDKIIKPNLFKSDKLFNIHFSLLPRYKGMYTSVHPILNGEKNSGVTLHEIDPGIDTGDILFQKSFEINIDDTSRDLYLKYLHYGKELIINNLPFLLNNNYSSKPQGFVNSSYYSKKSIDFNNIIIDLNKTSFEIHNQLRAYIFPEYQLPSLKNNLIKKSVIKDEFIGTKVFTETDEKIILSGIDGFKIEALKK
tara:strand:- start:63 stop:875 length:813 start_codon:yes stop_codon:yes gene_type:complete